MRVQHLRQKLAIVITAVCTSVISASAQQPAPPQNPDVIRVTTSLVQTDVMVFDKQGKFVDNIPREQFVLKVDGKPRAIDFFERVQAGSSNEEAQMAAARGTTSGGGVPVPLDRGRVIFFFIDDLHLSASSLQRVRAMLTRFIDRETGQNDRLAIVAASGQTGFLQQLTDNKAVLRRAISRLSPQTRNQRDLERPSMSEYHAVLVERNDRGVIDYFVTELIRQGFDKVAAEEMTRQRARAILEQSAHFSIVTLDTLKQLSRSAASLPGRKLVFFISDGFQLHTRDTVRQRANDLTAQAARTGVVIYSLDARGLVASLDDPSQPAEVDKTGRLQQASMGELTSSQDGMYTLAADTGGRAIFNSNDLLRGINTGLTETSKYYLLAWRPNSEDEKDNKQRRLAVSISGRSDLIVRFRRQIGELDAPAQPKKEKKEKTQVATTTEILRETFRAEHPKTSLPVYLSANFLNLSETGTMLVVAVKIATAKVPLEMVNDRATAQIDLTLAILDESGKSVKSFNKTLNLRSITTDVSGPPDFVLYRESPVVPPGLYQVRVAVVERKGRLAGSMHEWIEIPNLESKSLAMSSLIVGEKPSLETSLDVSNKDANANAGTNPFNDVRLNVDRRFTRDSHLRFLTFIYNAATAAQGNSAPAPGIEPARALMPSALPDLAIQVQVFRDDQPVITAAARKVNVEGTDPARVPYAADLSLEGLQAGSYVLQVTAIDRIARKTASQRFKFQVD